MNESQHESSTNIILANEKLLPAMLNATFASFLCYAIHFFPSAGFETPENFPHKKDIWKAHQLQGPSRS